MPAVHNLLPACKNTRSKRRTEALSNIVQEHYPTNHYEHGKKMQKPDFFRIEDTFLFCH